MTSLAQIMAWYSRGHKPLPDHDNGRHMASLFHNELTALSIGMIYNWFLYNCDILVNAFLSNTLLTYNM